MKYSKLYGGELLEKYGLKQIGIIVNSRAKRTLYPDNRVATGWDDLNDDDRIPTFYFQHGSMSGILKTGTELKVKISNNPGVESVAITIAQLKISCNEQDVFIAEIDTPVVKIFNRNITCDFHSNRYGGNNPQELEPEKLYKFFKDHLAEMCSGPIEPRIVKLVYSWYSNFKVPFGSYQWTRFLSNALQCIDNFPILESEEIFKYSKLIGNDNNYINNSSTKNFPIDTMAKLMPYFSFEAGFERILDDVHYESACGKYGSKYLNQNNSKFMEYSFTVRNLLLNAVLLGNASIETISDFLGYFNPSDFDEDVTGALEKFLSRDFRRCEIKQFKKMLNLIEKNNLPKNKATINIKFASSMKNEENLEYRGCDCSVKECFEKLLEDDAIKAIKYLNSHCEEFSI